MALTTTCSNINISCTYFILVLLPRLLCAAWFWLSLSEFASSTSSVPFDHRKLIPTMATKTVLITGSNRGIGFAFAQHYVKQGWNVIATARNVDSAEDLKNLKPWKLITLGTGDERSILRTAKALEGEVVDLLINNGGISIGGGLDVTTKEDMMRQFEVNTVGPFLWRAHSCPTFALL